MSAVYPNQKNVFQVIWSSCHSWPILEIMHEPTKIIFVAFLWKAINLTYKNKIFLCDTSIKCKSNICYYSKAYKRVS